MRKMGDVIKVTDEQLLVILAQYLASDKEAAEALIEKARQVAASSGELKIFDQPVCHGRGVSC